MNSTTIFPDTNYPQNVTGRKSGAARLCAAPLNYCPILAARMKAKRRALTTSSLFSPGSMSRVISAHSSSVKQKSIATCPCSDLGEINASIVARFVAGIGRCTRPSQLSTVRLLTCNFSASSSRLVPVRVSHSCNRSLNMAA